jgi:single-strand DNA-binding protein
MAGSINKVILVGNLCTSPEIKTTTSGSKIANFNVATNETWKDKNTGEKKDKVEYHRVVIFNQNLAEVAEKYLHKGSKVYIEGSLQTRKWTDKDGKEQRTTEIVLTAYKGEITLLDGKKQDDSYASENKEQEEDPDNKIPF